MGGQQLALPLGSPRAALAPKIRNSTNAAVYEAGSFNARTMGWRAPTVSPNSAILYSLAALRDRSRQAVRNNGFAKGIIDKLVTNIVGTGIKPLSKAADADFRKAVQALWLQWTDFSDADGVLDWYGQQAQAVRCWLEAGEVFVRLRQRLPEDGLPVPLQVQVLEPEMCPYTYNGTRGANKIRAGIEFDPVGRRAAYYFYASQPGALLDWNVTDLRRIPAESVIHLFDPLRAGQIRGLPHLTQALIKLYELDKFDDAALLRQQIANLFAGFVKRPADGGSDVHPLTGLAADATTAEGRPVLSLEPGIFQELSPGEEVEFSDPPDPPSTYPSFMRQQLMSISAATGVPYEVLTGDMAGLNDRVMRVVLHEFRRMIISRQHHIVAFQLCRTVWGAWLDRVVLSGALPIPAAAYAVDPRPWSAVKWMPQGWPYIHPVQDVTATKDAIRAGFTSRSAAVSEQGEDSEVIDAEQAADNERADELGLIYESDGRQAAKAPASGPPVPMAEPDDPATNPDDPPADPAAAAGA